MELSTQQSEAIQRIIEWYRNGGTVFRLFGYAGTGKTTIAQYAVQALGLDAAAVRYAAYTGKAAHVLASKGADPVSTIHSLIYMPKIQARKRLREMERDLATERSRPEPDQARIRQLEAWVRAERKRLESPEWSLRGPQESRLQGARLLVIDEVSMVNASMAKDLMSYGVPILVLGDPAQLPPVRGEGWFIDHAPDAMLTEVHRSALNSPVTDIATRIRTAETGDTRYGVRGQWADGSGRQRDLPAAALLDHDVVLVGTNATRWQAIQAIREMEGHRIPYPEVGDRIIVLANNGEAEVYNGQIYTVDRTPSLGTDKHDLTVIDDQDRVRDLTVWASGFTGTDGEKAARLTGGTGDTVAATYAAAITVHKAQGSEWGSVLVIDESHVFARMARGAPADRHRAGGRWLYTAATRAATRVTLTGSGTVR